jgi:hypothetical protein
MALTWFLDRTHACRETGRQLRKAGVTVIKHREVYAQDDLEDPVWLRECAAKGWIIISGDKGLHADGINRQAVIQSGAKVFILDDSSSKGIEWASALVTGRKKIEALAEHNFGPFYVWIEKNGDAHVGSAKFVGSGGPKEIKEPVMHEAQMALPSPNAVERENLPALPEPAEQQEMFNGERKNENDK